MKSIKTRLYPNKEQRSLLDRHFGSCRFVFNATLNFKIIMYKDYGLSKSKFDIINELPELKKEFEWLSECKAECLQNVIGNVDAAYQGFFRGGGFPKFKKKSSKQSFLQKQNFKVLENTNRLVFYKQKIKFRCSERDAIDLRTNKIKRITYSKDSCGHYYASILIDFNHELLEPNEFEIGIDLGLKEFAITSDAEVIANPRFLRKSSEKLALLQRRHSRKKKGSRNREKARIAIAKQYKKVTNQRRDFQHKLSSQLIHKNQVIYIESLKDKNMVKNRKLAKSISDASWSSFTGMLEYKAKWYGRQVIKIGTFEPSSKLCSRCGWKKEDLTLSDRVFNCRECGLEIDRDYNAALNILKIGMSNAELTLEETKSLDSRRTKKRLTEDLNPQ